jgi:hypothetical protein
MKRKRHSPDEVIRKLSDAEKQLGAGSRVADVPFRSSPACWKLR